MKYNDKNKPLVCMQTNSTCYNNTYIMKIRGILWHSTGANNPTLKRYVQPTSNNDPMINILGKNNNGNDWNHIHIEAGLNAWIGELANGEVAAVQTMPWNYAPWGCGGACNDGWIQFEICEDSLQDRKYFNAVYKEACELTAYLCKLYNIDPNSTVVYNGKKVPTILCHKDSYDLGMGSGHGDVLHWFPKFGKNMSTVRADVSALLKEKEQKKEEPKVTYDDFKKFMTQYEQEKAKQEVSTWAKDAWNEAVNLKVFDGTTPRSPLTREQAALILDRLNLLNKN